jgi:branched-chain amino acid transport system permease protein
VLAAYLILWLAGALHLGVILGFAVALPLMFAAGYLLQAGLLNRVLGDDILAPLLTTFGLSIILQNAMLYEFSADSRRLTSDGIENASLPLFDGVAIGVMPLLTFAAAVGVIVALNQLFYRTALGRAFRAVSDDPSTARLMGIDDRQLFAVAMGIALVVCTIAALFLGLRANFDPTIGPGRLIFAFEAVIIGGLGSLWGTLAGGVILGVAQTIGASINPEWQLLAGHVAFIVVLAVAPRGLFPRAVD